MIKLNTNSKTSNQKISAAFSASFFCVLFYALPNTLHAQTNEHVSQAAQNFEGLAIQAAVGYQPYVINLNQLGITNTNIKLNDQNYYNSSVPYFFGASYTAAISRDITIGAQVEINPINQQFVVSLLPGYALTPDIQGYLKFAWVNAMMNVNQISNQNKISATVNGMTAGLGLKKFWTPSWYGFIEANYVKMDTIKFNNPINGIPINGNMDYSGYNAMIGIGYKF